MGKPGTCYGVLPFSEFIAVVGVTREVKHLSTRRKRK